MEGELADGFHLLIDALRLNGLNTIYGVPGIPVTDFGRLAQASGMRVISFRHEQHAGHAAAIAGYTSRDELTAAVERAPGSGAPTLVDAVIDESAGTESGRIGNLDPQSSVGKQ